MSADDLGKYFDALAADATTEKGLLEELVKANAALTATNNKLSYSVVAITKANDQLSRQVGNRRNNHNRGDSPAPRTKKMCPHCKIECTHIPDNFFIRRKTLINALRDEKVVCDSVGTLL